MTKLSLHRELWFHIYRAVLRDLREVGYHLSNNARVDFKQNKDPQKAAMIHMHDLFICDGDLLIDEEGYVKDDIRF